MKYISILVFGFIGTTAGCQFDPYGSDYTKVQPTREDVAGIYKVDPKTVNSFKAQHGVDPAAAEINLKPDGSFELKEMPACWLAVTCAGRLQSASGTWSIQKHQEWWALSLETRELDGRKHGHYSEAMLRGEKRPYLVHFTIGDPDSGQALVLEPKK